MNNLWHYLERAVTILAPVPIEKKNHLLKTNVAGSLIVDDPVAYTLYLIHLSSFGVFSAVIHWTIAQSGSLVHQRNQNSNEYNHKEKYTLLDV